MIMGMTSWCNSCKKSISVDDDYVIREVMKVIIIKFTKVAANIAMIIKRTIMVVSIIETILRTTRKQPRTCL